MTTDPLGVARALPSMGGAEIGEVLIRYAARVPREQAIVEVGCWLGAGTAHLAIGAGPDGPQIHVYDRFRIRPGEPEQATGYDLTPGQDTLPLVRRTLEHFPARVTFHRGDIRRARWTGKPIGLYVDDASKSRQAWNRVMWAFGRWLVPGGVMVLMDFHFRPGMAQVAYMDARPNKYEIMEDRVAGTTTRIYRKRC